MVSQTVSPAISVVSVHTEEIKEDEVTTSPIEWIQPSFTDPKALGKGMFPFKRDVMDDSQLVIHDITILGTVVLVDLKAGVTFNHVVDIRVEETEILKLKKFMHGCSKIPSEDGGEVKWNDTPIRLPGNIVHCVSKRDIQLPFTYICDAHKAIDPFVVEPEIRVELLWMNITRDSQVLVEVIPKIYRMANKYGITLHILVVGLLQGAGMQTSEGSTSRLLLWSPKKKRKVE